MSGPPRLASWIIAAVTERNDRPWLVADLDELYRARRSQHGRWRADSWYWQQVVRSIPPLVARRLQPGRLSLQPNDSMSTSTHDRSEPEKFSAALYNLRHAFRRLSREPPSRSRLF